MNKYTLKNIMESEKMLESAIKKAWDVKKVEHSPYHEGGGFYVYFKDDKVEYFKSEEQLIFSHDFAKAFWKNDIRITYKKICLNVECGVVYTAVPKEWEVRHCYLCNARLSRVEGEKCHYWKHHLQEMVLEEDPIKYLQQFLDE